MEEDRIERRMLNNNLERLIGQLSANVSNLSKNFESIAQTQKEMGIAISQMVNDRERIKTIEASMVDLKSLLKDNETSCKARTFEAMEHFDLCRDDKVNIKKDFSFLRSLRENSEQTKRRLINTFIVKIVEFSLMFFIIKMGIKNVG